MIYDLITFEFVKLTWELRLTLHRSLLHTEFDSFTFGTISFQIIYASVGSMLRRVHSLKSNSFDVRQTVFYAYACKFGLVL